MHICLISPTPLLCGSGGKGVAENPSDLPREHDIVKLAAATLKPSRASVIDCPHTPASVDAIARRMQARTPPHFKKAQSQKDEQPKADLAAQVLVQALALVKPQQGTSAARYA